MMNRNGRTLRCLVVAAILIALNSISSAAQEVTRDSLKIDELIVAYIADRVTTDTNLKQEFEAFRADKNAQNDLRRQLEKYLDNDRNWASKTAKLIKILDDEFGRVEKDNKQRPWPLCLSVSKCKIPKQKQTKIPGIAVPNPVARVSMEYIAVLLESASSGKADVFRQAVKLIRENECVQREVQKYLETKLPGNLKQEEQVVKVINTIRPNFKEFIRLISDDKQYIEVKTTSPQCPATKPNVPPVPWPLCIFWRGCS